MLLTKELKKYLKSLHQIKFRQKYNKFIAEGPKICFEFIESAKFEIDYILCTDDLFRENEQLISRSKGKTIICNDKELKSISGLMNPNKILMVLSKIDFSAFSLDFEDDWGIYCDRIQDPGNMGTIMRIADWFGFSTVMASSDSVEFYNPKVVQSAMGAHNRLKFTATEREEFVERYSDISYVLALDGKDLEETSFSRSGLIVVGNESKGVCEQIMRSCQNHIRIKKYGGAESLNASIACGIACFHIANIFKS